MTEVRPAQAPELAGITTAVDAPSFAFLAKGGSWRCRREVVLIAFPQQKQIAHAASPPTLAKNARMGHPQWE